MAGPGDADDRAELHERISATCARIEALCHGADALAYGLSAMRPRLVREAQYGEQNFDSLFMAQFFCRSCGPTNRVCADDTGLICIVCQQAAAYQVFDRAKFLPQS